MTEFLECSAHPPILKLWRLIAGQHGTTGSLLYRLTLGEAGKHLSEMFAARGTCSGSGPEKKYLGR